MTTIAKILASLREAGIDVAAAGTLARQGALLQIGGYPRLVRVYAWKVTDNGAATGEERSADERRIQAIGSVTQTLKMSVNPETLVLGWSEDFSDAPVIVAFNAYGVTGRVNGKVDRKMMGGDAAARASDSQQFKQDLIDQACASGLAVGQNQHGEYVVAMQPHRFLDYLNGEKPLWHTFDQAHLVDATSPLWMVTLVQQAKAALDDGEIFDPLSVEDSRRRIARSIVARQGQGGFRDGLMDIYEGRCAVTGYDVPEALEAAHIIPYSGADTNHLANGLLLRADVHTLFDFDLLTVDPETLTVVLAQSLMDTEYRDLHGLSLRPPSGSVQPSRDALRQRLTRLRAGGE